MGLAERLDAVKDMFRNSSGSLSFSFGRLVQNAVPNFANDTPSDDADVSLLHQDLLFEHQLHTAEPTRLDDTSFKLAGVVGGLLNSGQS